MLIVSVLGLAFIGLVATAAFTVMAQRRQRALGMLASLGATEARRQVRADRRRRDRPACSARSSAAALGLGLWFWYYPHLETATAHRTDPLNLPWAAVVIGLLLAVATSVIAAAWPGRAVSKVPVVAAISGRVSAPHVVRRSLRPGLIFLAAGLFVLFFSGGWNGGGGDGYLVIAGLIACVIACALLAPFIVDRLARLAWRAPLATRLALRDLARYRSRSGAALAAVSFAVFLATIAIVIASIRYDDALDYIAPNMASNQLIIYNPGNDPTQYQPGQVTPAAKLAATQASRRTRSPRSCTRPPRSSSTWRSASTSRQPGQPTQNQSGAIVSPARPWGRRPHVRGHSGPAQGVRRQPERGEPGRRRAHRARADCRRRASLALVSGSFIAESPPGCPAGYVHPEPGHPGGEQAARRHLPAEHGHHREAVKALHETIVPVGWLIQAPDRAHPGADQRGPPGRGRPRHHDRDEVRPAQPRRRSATAPPSAASSSRSACWP